MHIYIETHTARFDGALFEVALQPVCPSGEKPAAFVRIERFDRVNLVATLKLS